MARFCSSCGSAVEGNLKVCPKCGAQLGAPAAPAAAPAAPGGTPAAKKGSPVLKIILAVVGLFAFITVASIGGCVYLAYRAKQKFNAAIEYAKENARSSGTPEIHLESGGAGSKMAAAATVDVPPYPDSSPTKSGGGISFGGLGAVSAQEYETPDSVDKVLAYYKDKFGSRVTVQEAEGNATFSLKAGNAVTTVAITRAEGAEKTKITITRAGK